MRFAPVLALLLLAAGTAGADPRMAAPPCRETRLDTVVCPGPTRPQPRPPGTRPGVPWTSPSPGDQPEGPPPMVRRSRLGLGLQPGLGDSVPAGTPCRQTRLGDLRC